MSDSAVHMIAHGRVQGVCFRFFVRDLASSTGVKGWVKNLPDGTVEIHAEGEKGALFDFIKEVKKGPYLGYVSELTTDWVTTDNKYSSFNITF